MSFVFYDTETTGTNTWFDQILQFAAIKTDADLNEVDRFEIRCRLMLHVVPSPGAMRVTGVRASQLTDPAYCSHYEMMRAINAKLLSWSPATFVGYNTLEYDEDLMRQALYKTLHSPYLTQTNGNARSDVLRMAHACNLFAPNILAVPLGDNGRQVFKLDRLAPANGFKHDRAHDAMGDVEATIHLCKLISERAPEVWSAFMRFARKPAVIDFVTAEPVFCLSEIYYGRAYSYLVTAIGQDADNSNEWYLFDLQVAPEPLLGLSQAQLENRLARSPKPFRIMRANGIPILFAADDAPAGCKGLEHGLAELERRAAVLQENEEFRARLIAAHLAGKADYPPSPHVERQIYDGFFGAEQALMNAFHEAPWSERPAIVDRFADPRLKTIGRRLIHSERPDLMDPDVRLAHDREYARRITGQDDDSPWLIISAALDELEGLLADASDADAVLLQEHREFLLEQHRKALTFITPSGARVGA